MFNELINRLDARQQLLLAGGCLALLVASLFMYVLLPQIKTYRQSLESLEILEGVASQGQAVSQQLARLSAEVSDLDRQLHGDMANLPEEQLESFVIGRLQTISWRNAVELVSIEPSSGETVQAFQESLYRVELAGSYFDLYNWLGEINDELGFVVIKEYEMEPAEDVTIDPNLTVNLTIASYRLTSS
jgi:type II secretory pathway component PulM